MRWNKETSAIRYFGGGERKSRRLSRSPRATFPAVKTPSPSSLRSSAGELRISVQFGETLPVRKTLLPEEPDEAHETAWACGRSC